MPSVARLARVLGVGLLILTGCGPPKSEKLVKTDIELRNAYAAEFEAIAKKPSAAGAQEIQKRMTKIVDDMKENRLEWEKVPIEQLKAAKKKYEAEIKQSTDRFQNAQRALLPLIEKKTPTK